MEFSAILSRPRNFIFNAVAFSLVVCNKKVEPLGGVTNELVHWL